MNFDIDIFLPWNCTRMYKINNFSDSEFRFWIFWAWNLRIPTQSELMENEFFEFKLQFWNEFAKFWLKNTNY